MVVQDRVVDTRFTELVGALEDASARDVIEAAVESFGDRVALCTSFQAEGMVILDIASRLPSQPRVFTIDTGRLPQETYNLIDAVRDRYGVEVDVHHPDNEDLTQFAGEHGVNPFYRSVALRLACCEIRKVNPLNRALAGYDAWITGLRRTQNKTRASVAKVELDPAHGGMLKLNPLADWDYERVWQYIRDNDVPYNSLYDKGYTSIGCAPCTRPIEPGEDLRAGRWWWENGFPSECGIHLDPAQASNGRRDDS
jgi:thioredoxin-dependent adenylylsulfate APS reductase